MNYNLILQECHSMIKLNPKHEPMTEQIIMLVKTVIKNTKYCNACMIEMQERFDDGIDPSDIPYLIKTLLALNRFIEDVNITDVNLLRYILYSMIIMYIDSKHYENYDFEPLRKFLDSSFDLLTIDPRELVIIQKLKKTSLNCCY